MTIQSGIQLCHDVLSESNAVSLASLDSTFAQLRGDGELQRAFKIPNIEHVGDFEEFFNEYTSASNTSKHSYVIDPQVDHIVHEGRYRQAYLQILKLRDDSGDEHTYLVQILRKGYIESLGANGNIDWSEARLYEHRLYPTNSNTRSDDPATYLTVQWPNVSEKNSTAIATYLSGQKTATPRVNGKTLGEHRVLFALDTQEDDGSSTVRMYLGNPQFQLEAYSYAETERHTDLTILHGCPRSLAQTILDDFKTVGASAEVGGIAQNGTLTLYLYQRVITPNILLNILTRADCQYLDYTSYYWSVDQDDEGDYTIPSSRTDGWTYDKRVTSNADGTIDITITIRKRQYRNFAERTLKKSGTSETKERLQLGVTTQSTPSIDTIDTGEVKTQYIDYENDCTKKVRTRTKESVEREQEIEWETRYGTASRHSFWNQRSKPSQIDALDSTTSNNVSDGLNEDDTKDFVITKRPYQSSHVSYLTTSKQYYETVTKTVNTTDDDGNPVKKYYVQYVPVWYRAMQTTIPGFAHSFVDHGLPGSKASNIGDDLWAAIRVTQRNLPIGNITDDPRQGWVEIAQPGDGGGGQVIKAVERPEEPEEPEEEEEE